MREGQKRDEARSLRQNSTEAEHRMWLLLRDRRYAGIKFRRQVPVGPFIADFACFKHKLIVEIDGGQHSESTRDIQRDRYLQSAGWRVLRFWNNDVLQNQEGVWQRLEQALALTPTLSRKRERESERRNPPR